MLEDRRGRRATVVEDSRIRGLGDEIRKADRHAGGLDGLPVPFVAVFPLHRGRER